MKRISLVLSIVLLCYKGFSFENKKHITDTIEVAYDKEVILLFDSEIKEHIISVDPEKPDVLFETHTNKGVLQAAINFKKLYNLYIETETGEYLFIIKYNENPKDFFYKYTSKESLISGNQNTTSSQSQSFSSKVLKKEEKNNNEIVEDEKKINPEVKKYSKQAYNSERNVQSIGTYFKKTIFELSAIYVDDENIYFVLDVKNTSEINYNIDFVKFVIRNKKKTAKVAAIQEETVPTLYIYEENKHLVSGLSKEKLVYCFKKFTIHPTKLLHVELWEKGGDRKVEFTLTADELLQAKKIN